jgi:hypothetical protein
MEMKNDMKGPRHVNREMGKGPKKSRGLLKKVKVKVDVQSNQGLVLILIQVLVLDLALKIVVIKKKANLMPNKVFNIAHESKKRAPKV